MYQFTSLMPSIHGKASGKVVNEFSLFRLIVKIHYYRIPITGIDIPNYLSNFCFGKLG